MARTRAHDSRSWVMASMLALSAATRELASAMASKRGATASRVWASSSRRRLLIAKLSCCDRS
ncbi:hypothetical protein ABZX90_38455 [Streptomyces sp. NPDC002935]|uniref:hypothetical protein n=1 Tax=Streptomyces sp. NPDC002935 TaxID=3154545 RepID=UPI0033B69BCF